jgi:hypothetical protein
VKIAPKTTGIQKLLRRDYSIDRTCEPGRTLAKNDRLLLLGEMDNIKQFIG